MGHIKPKGGVAFLTSTAPTSTDQGRSHVYLTLCQIYILLHLRDQIVHIFVHKVSLLLDLLLLFLYPTLQLRLLLLA